MNGIQTKQTPEGEKYELHWEGHSKTFDSKQEANEVLLLHTAKDAGRQLTEEEERKLITYTE